MDNTLTVIALNPDIMFGLPMELMLADGIVLIERRGGIIFVGLVCRHKYKCYLFLVKILCTKNVTTAYITLE